MHALFVHRWSPRISQQNAKKILRHDMLVNVIFGLLHNLLPFVKNQFLTWNCSASKRNKCIMYTLQLIYQKCCKSIYLMTLENNKFKVTSSAVSQWTYNQFWNSNISCEWISFRKNIFKRIKGIIIIIFESKVWISSCIESYSSDVDQEQLNYTNWWNRCICWQQ